VHWQRITICLVWIEYQQCSGWTTASQTTTTPLQRAQNATGSCRDLEMDVWKHETVAWSTAVTPGLQASCTAASMASVGDAVSFVYVVSRTIQFSRRHDCCRRCLLTRLSCPITTRQRSSENCRKFNDRLWASECPDVKNTNDSFWHRMLYSCIHMAAVGVKGLTGF